MTAKPLGAWARWVTLAVVTALVVAGSLWWLVLRPTGMTVTAYFPSAVSLYEDSDVRILGVRVGHVTGVHPEGDRVRVHLKLDDDVAVPADAKAAVVIPTLVADRYVQLAPAYTGGARMADGAVIPRERTAVPVEIDEVYDALDRLSGALGPEGANRAGALSELLRVGADNLRGNGAQFNRMIKELSAASGTLAGSRKELFGTLTELRKFTSTLAASDPEIRRFTDQMAEVSGFLADDRTKLRDALREASHALGTLADFVRDNRSALDANVAKLTRLSQILVKQRAALAEILDVAPSAINNLMNTYDPSSGTLHARLYLNEFQAPPLLMACDLVRRITPNPPEGVGQRIENMCKPVQKVIDGTVRLPTANEALAAVTSGDLSHLPPLTLFPGKQDQDQEGSSQSSQQPGGDG